MQAQQARKAKSYERMKCRKRKLLVHADGTRQDTKSSMPYSKPKMKPEQKTGAQQQQNPTSYTMVPHIHLAPRNEMQVTIARRSLTGPVAAMPYQCGRNHVWASGYNSTYEERRFRIEKKGIGPCIALRNTVLAVPNYATPAQNTNPISTEVNKESLGSTQHMHAHNCDLKAIKR